MWDKLPLIITIAIAGFLILQHRHLLQCTMQQAEKIHLIEQRVMGLCATSQKKQLARPPLKRMIMNVPKKPEDCVGDKCTIPASPVKIKHDMVTISSNAMQIQDFHGMQIQPQSQMHVQRGQSPVPFKNISDNDSEDDMSTIDEPIQTFSSPSNIPIDIDTIVKEVFNKEELVNMHFKDLKALAKTKGISLNEGKRPKSKEELATEILTEEKKTKSENL